MPKTTALNQALLDLVVGGQAYSPSATLHFALYNVAPGVGGGGTEVSGGSYARVSIANNLTNFPAANSSSQKSNGGTAITWPTASASWGAVTAIGIHNSGGTLLYWTTITTKNVDSGDTVSIAISNLTLTEA